MKMSNINRRVWKAIGTNYILFGTVVEEKMENDWHMVRVKWSSPHSTAPLEEEWQKIQNLGDVKKLIVEFLNESR
jgi:hypothetical protein|tara:strand:+ start:507 stop:731 length:225 start_codon:yes stop_codon:yes gene_type:complete